MSAPSPNPNPTPTPPAPQGDLRDGLGKALGAAGALIFCAPAHQYSVDFFWAQIAPFGVFMSYQLWSVLWLLCVFCILYMSIRYGWMLIISLITHFFTTIVVRLSLPRRRG